MFVATALENTPLFLWRNNRSHRFKPNQRNLEITVVFGSAEVLLPDNVNFDIDPTSVFGSTSFQTAGK
jgi:hypothetical protein